MIIGMVQFFVRAAQALYKGLSEDFYRQVSSFCGSRLQIGKLLPLSHKQGTHKHNAFLRVHGLKKTKTCASAIGESLVALALLQCVVWGHQNSYGACHTAFKPTPRLSTKIPCT